jgi:hypothetical protein
LRFAGRLSGRLIALPVAYAVADTDAGTVVVVLVGRSIGKTWWHNFRHEYPVEVLIDGRWRAGTGQVVTVDTPEHQALLRVYRAAHRVAPSNMREPLVRIRLR